MQGVYIRLIFLVICIIISFHFILSLTHDGYRSATSFSSIAASIRGSQKHNITEDYPFFNSSGNGTSSIARRANATLVMLARNSDLDGAVRSVRGVEDRFNRNFGYPYVFLNEEPFTDAFKKRISVLTNAKVEFGLIPRDHWFQPSWIDEQKAAAERHKMTEENVIYGGSISYRNMCRFNSGFFFHHPLLQKYKYYWRIEPDVHFHCDVTDDPFLLMQEKNKIYGFAITMYEFKKTIKSLWETVKEFVKKHPQYVAENNSMGFLSSDHGDTYNLCHFWSNFEIADMDFWRGKIYSEFFKYLDSTGGFYYERWGDAPVHSIAVGLFARKDQIHFFEEMGYEHNPYTHCPKSVDAWTKGKCSCDQARSFDYDGYSCLRKWDEIIEL